MAKVLLGANMVGVSGKLAGHVFQTGKNGTIWRSKVKPRKHQRANIYSASGIGSNNVAAWHSYRVMIAQSWRTLTPAERQTWYDNELEGLTGFPLYMRYQTPYTIGPGFNRTFPGYPGPMANIRLANYNEAGGQPGAYGLVITCVSTPPTTPVFILMSPPGSPGRKRNAAGWSVIQFGALTTQVTNFAVQVSDYGYPKNFFYHFAYRIGYAFTGYFQKAIPFQFVT